MFGRHAVVSSIVSVFLTVIFLRKALLIGTEEERNHSWVSFILMLICYL
jgi:hypothetical protein